MCIFIFLTDTFVSLHAFLFPVALSCVFAESTTRSLLFLVAYRCCVFQITRDKYQFVGTFCPHRSNIDREILQLRFDVKATLVPSDKYALRSFCSFTENHDFTSCLVAVDTEQRPATLSRSTENQRSRFRVDAALSYFVLFYATLPRIYFHAEISKPLI